MPTIRATVAYFYYRLGHRSRRVATSRVMLSVIAEYFYDLREVGLPREHVLDPLAVKVETIGRKLKAMLFGESAAKIIQELVRYVAVTLSDCVSRNQFRLGINRNKHPRIANFCRIVSFHMALLFGDERPNLIALDMFASKAAHLGIHQSYGTLPGENEQAKDRVSMQLRNALDSANARPFDQELNRQKSLFFRDNHRSKETPMFFRICLATLWASKTAQSVTVLSELLACDGAISAIHSNKIQQAHAVCQIRYLFYIFCYQCVKSAKNVLANYIRYN